MDAGYLDINIHNEMIMVKDEYIKHLEEHIESLKLKIQNLESLLNVEHHYWGTDMNNSFPFLGSLVDCLPIMSYINEFTQTLYLDS
jgi:hypothetical protein